MDTRNVCFMDVYKWICQKWKRQENKMDNTASAIHQ